MSGETMRAIGVSPRRRELREYELPLPRLEKDNEILIRAVEVGICGTDREICAFAYGAPPPGDDYLILGHECLGEVVETGAAARRFRKGDLVVPSVRRPCADADCRPCREGLQDFCLTGGFTERGINGRHGFMSEYFTEEEAYLTPAPESVRETAVMTEPLTIAEKGLSQAWKVQGRLPWAHPGAGNKNRGRGLNAVVLGAGPVGILGAMKLLTEGFTVFVYSRSPKPNPKAELVESVGAEYVSALECGAARLAEMAGRIDLVYEAAGQGGPAFELLNVLGTNGVYIFTGIPEPAPPAPLPAAELMRNITLKNLAVVGTVNADQAAFAAAVRDLGEFGRRWPQALVALITRHVAVSHRELLLGKASGIKNVIRF